MRLAHQPPAQIQCHFERNDPPRPPITGLPNPYCSSPNLLMGGAPTAGQPVARSKPTDGMYHAVRTVPPFDFISRQRMFQFFMQIDTQYSKQYSDCLSQNICSSSGFLGPGSSPCTTDDNDAPSLRTTREGRSSRMTQRSSARRNRSSAAQARPSVRSPHRCGRRRPHLSTPVSLGEAFGEIQD